MTGRRSPSSVAGLRRGVAAAVQPPAELPAVAPVVEDQADEDQAARQPAKGPTWDARISLTASADMKRALDLARVDDGIEATARIRAMITLWQEDPRLRARVDKLAKSLR